MFISYHCKNNLLVAKYTLVDYDYTAASEKIQAAGGQR